MQTIEIYGQDDCPWCVRAKVLCEKRGFKFTYRDMAGDPSLEAEFVTRSNGAATVPQIFVGATHIGGFTDLAAADRSGALQQMIASQ